MVPIIEHGRAMIKTKNIAGNSLKLHTITKLVINKIVPGFKGNCSATSSLEGCAFFMSHLDSLQLFISLRYAA